MEGAQAAQGRTAEALASGRQALAIYAKQMESPGLPPDIAATHLSLLEKEWRRTGDAALAAEYFQTLSLVWDSAAARTTAQLAARLVLKQAGDQARVYQDAERAYRAALARQQQLAGDADTPTDQTKPPPTRRCRTPPAASPRPRPPCATRRRPISNCSIRRPRPPICRRRWATTRPICASSSGAPGGYAVLVDKAGVHPFIVALTGDQVDALADRFQRSTHLQGRRLPDFDSTPARSSTRP